MGTVSIPRTAFSNLANVGVLGVGFMRSSYTEETTMHLLARHVFQFQCPLCQEHTVLPRQSPLGTYVGQQYQPSGIWPINFLCFRYEQACEVGHDAIHLETIVVQAPVSGEAALWQIECECAHENCGMHHAIYTKYLADEKPANVVGIVLNASPTIACTWTHPVVFLAEKMTAEKFEF